MATSFSKLNLRETFDRLVATRVDIASLAAFRILFGLLMAAAMVRFMANGWVTELYVTPAFHFTYPGFEWIRPWPGAGMHLHFFLLALLAIGVAVGSFYRCCITLFFLGFTYVELLDQTAYLNHYYLISLLSGLMIFLPAHRAWSFDAWRNPQFRLDGMPAWALNILRFQVSVVYVFAGLAKFNADWLFKAEPLRIWLAARSDLPLIGPLLNETWVAYAASWFGAGFDTFIVLFLLNRRTRRVAYLMVIIFHVATWILFPIGMFPWIMIAAATVFFPADWPRYWVIRFLAVVSPWVKSPKVAPGISGAMAIEHSLRLPNSQVNRKLLVLLGIYIAIQLALPLRPYFTTASPAWTCSSFNCAWQVMIVEKTGYTEFYAFEPATGKRSKLSLDKYLTPRQQIMMAQDPYLIRQMARRLAADLKAQGFAQAQVKVDAHATLNGRPSQRLINSEVDLAGKLPAGWILPLEN